MDNPDKLTT